jgi:ketosteroid isomerase-like protein
MSEENVEAIRAVYERFSKGDFRASLDVVDPLVLFVQRPGFPESGTYLGIARGRKVIRLENFRNEAEALEAAGLQE